MLCLVAAFLPGKPIETNWPPPRLPATWTLSNARLVCRQLTAAVDEAHPAWLQGAASYLTEGLLSLHEVHAACAPRPSHRCLLAKLATLEVEVDDDVTVGYLERFDARRRKLGQLVAAAAQLRRLRLAVAPARPGWVHDLFAEVAPLDELDLIGRLPRHDAALETNFAAPKYNPVNPRTAPLELAAALPAGPCAGLRTLALSNFLAADPAAVVDLVARLPQLTSLRLEAWDPTDESDAARQPPDPAQLRFVRAHAFDELALLGTWTDDFAGVLQVLCRLPRLRRLHLDGPRDKQVPDPPVLPNLPLLEELTLAGWLARPSFLAGPWPQETLRRLVLRPYEEERHGERVFCRLPSMPRLHCLQLTGIKFVADDLRYFELPALPQLRELRLLRVDWRGAARPAAALPRRLRELDVSYGPTFQFAILAEAMASLPELQRLSLKDEPYCTGDLLAASLPQLRELWLSCSLHSAQLRRLQLARFPKLQRLELDRCVFDGRQSLVAWLTGASSLSSLDWWESEVYDEDSDLSDEDSDLFDED